MVFVRKSFRVGYLVSWMEILWGWRRLDSSMWLRPIVVKGWSEGESRVRLLGIGGTRALLGFGDEEWGKTGGCGRDC